MHSQMRSSFPLFHCFASKPKPKLCRFACWKMCVCRLFNTPRLPCRRLPLCCHIHTIDQHVWRRRVRGCVCVHAARGTTPIGPHSPVSPYHVSPYYHVRFVLIHSRRVCSSHTSRIKTKCLCLNRIFHDCRFSLSKAPAARLSVLVCSHERKSEIRFFKCPWHANCWACIQLEKPTGTHSFARTYTQTLVNEMRSILIDMMRWICQKCVKNGCGRQNRSRHRVRT